MYPEIQLFNHTFISYNVAALFSVATAFVLSWFFVKKIDYSFRKFLFIFVMIILVFPVGARLLNVALNYTYYSTNPYEIFKFSFRGFSVIGGIAASISICFIIHKFMHQNFITFLDALSIPFMLSFSIMKLGCFFNGCCYGKATSSFMGIEFPKTDTGVIDELVSIFSSFAGIPKSVYPTQLFEAILALLFIPIFIVLKKRYSFKSPGQTFIFTGIYFTTLRLIVHPFRVFPYPKYIVTYIYPLAYITVIIFGVLYLKKEQKNSLL